MSKHDPRDVLGGSVLRAIAYSPKQTRERPWNVMDPAQQIHWIDKARVYRLQLERRGLVIAAAPVAE